jgi:regulator of nucleoside diphosphate kinase
MASHDVTTATAPEPRAPTAPPICVTREDEARLRALIERHAAGALAAAAEQLEVELDRARVVAQRDMPPDVVTMRSKVLFEDVETGQRREATLMYPDEADFEQGLLSVLAPVGVALLGVRAGDTIQWPVPGARTRTLRVVSVPYQPEAAGDLNR